MLKISFVYGCASLAVALMLMPEASAAETRFPAQTVVAVRGSAAVTMEDVDAALIVMPAGQRANFMNSPKRIEELVERLLINKQLANEARAGQLDKNPLFQLAVSQQADRMLTDQLAMKLRAEVSVGEVELLAKERYDVNPDAFTIPARAHVWHILIATKDRTDAEAKKIAETVRAKALAGEDFVELVSKYSDDSSKRTNLGEIPDGEAEGLVPEFIAAVKQMKTKGEISPVVKTSFGYHIIKLEDRYPARAQSFDQVKERIMKELADRMRDSLVKEHIDQLKALELEANPEAVASLRTRYLPEGASAEPDVPKKK